MAKSIIVFGPQGCGKSLNAELLRKAFGLDLVDDTTPSALSMLPTGVLYLTEEIPKWLLPSEAKILCMPYGEAMAHVEAYKLRIEREHPVMKLSSPTLKVKRLNPAAQLPQYQTPGAACFDLHSLEASILTSGEQQTFRIGLAFEVPPGFFMAVFSRSGQGFKHGVRLANGTGVIDADFRGELMVSLRNDGDDYYHVKVGDRIAQATLIAINRWHLLEVDELSETVRGANGGGSTGV